MNKAALLAGLGLALAVSGGASAEFRSPGEVLAQTSPSPPSTDMNRDRDRSTPPAASPSSPPSGATSPGTGSSGMGSPSSPGMGSSATLSDADLRGKDLVDSSGSKIGEIKDVQGQNVVVSVGGFLGLGQKDVLMPKANLTATGTGEDRKIQTSMTKEQIKDMEEHKADTSRGSTSTPSTGRSSPPASPATPSR